MEDIVLVFVLVHSHHHTHIGISKKNRCKNICKTYNHKMNEVFVYIKSTLKLTFMVTTNIMPQIPERWIYEDKFS